MTDITSHGLTQRALYVIMKSSPDHGGQPMNTHHECFLCYESGAVEDGTDKPAEWRTEDGYPVCDEHHLEYCGWYDIDRTEAGYAETYRTV